MYFANEMSSCIIEMVGRGMSKSEDNVLSGLCDIENGG